LPTPKYFGFIEQNILIYCLVSVQYCPPIISRVIINVLKGIIIAVRIAYNFGMVNNKNKVCQQIIVNLEKARKI